MRIIEDKSPYYTTFEHRGITKIINLCLDEDVCKLDRSYHVRLHKLSPEKGREIIDLLPYKDLVPLDEARTTIILTQPGGWHRAHKDGEDMRVGINYPIYVKDDACTTNWYSEQEMSAYKYVHARELDGFKKNNHTPEVTVIAREGTAMLINTDLFHNWDNSRSKNLRAVLCLRMRPETKDSVYYNDLRKALFPH